MAETEIRLFRYFVALAEEQHFTRAALRLKISPPTLTHQIKKLESQLGAKLVERSGNTHLEITEAGLRFLERARHVLQQVEEAEIAARQAARGEVGRIEIGYQYVVSCSGVLQTFLSEFQRANPAIEIILRHMITMDQINAILRSELDIGFGRPPGKYPAGLLGFSIYRQPIILALPRDHPLARRKTIKPADLAEETFVNPPVENDFGFLRHVESVCAIGGFIPKVIKRALDSFTVLTYVSAGYGIAIVSQSLSKIALPNVIYRKIESANLPSTSVTVMHRRDEPSPAVRGFIEFVRRRHQRN